MNTFGGYEGDRPAQPHRAHLRRLDAGYYRGRTVVHWTLGIHRRAVGWLNTEFHHRWDLMLLHASVRYGLVSPGYVLMPDHIHLVWLGVRDDAEQRPAIEFLRRELRSALLPAAWQRQPYDHVLTRSERSRNAFQSLAHYVLQNPVRAGIAAQPADYPYSGCCVPGFPALNVHDQGYWDSFWRIHNQVLVGRDSLEGRSDWD